VIEARIKEMMKALVTGGAGFIGSNLVAAIVDKYDVTVLDNFHTGSMSNLDLVREDVNLIKGSCNDCLAFDLSPDVIYHLGIPSSSPMYKSNPLLVGEAINGMIAIMELAKRCGTRKVVFASSSSLYNGIPTPHREDASILVTDYYTEARLAIERVAELYNKLFGVDYAALRFFSVYGQNERAKGSYANMITQFLWTMQKGQAPVIYGDGTQTRDFTFVEDVTAAMVMVAGRGTGVFNLGTGKSYSFNYVVDMLNEKLGTSLKPDYKENPIRNYVKDTQADTSKMKALGFEAKWSLEEGIEQTIMHG
jgi:UDP-glucose 4-epimerase